MSLPALDILSLLRESGFHAKKGLGQNFLRDESALKRIVETAGIEPRDEVLEIGAGLGSLTRHLALKAKRVCALEIDSRMIPLLEQVLAGQENIEIVQGDILKLQPEDLGLTRDYLVVANIPYYITSAIIRHLLEANIKPRRIVLTVQAEVGERICALPGKMNLLALSVQVFGHPQIMFNIPSAAFTPEPDVDSSVIRVDLHPEPLIASSKLDTFFRLAKTAFSQKRKTLRNSLAGSSGLKTSESGPLLTAASIDPMRRAETLTLEEWGVLTARYLELRKN